jgi:hypothetical protein
VSKIRLGTSSLTYDKPTPLFATNLEIAPGFTNRSYTVSRDGRFLIGQALETAPAPITLLLNWKPR